MFIVNFFLQVAFTNFSILLPNLIKHKIRNSEAIMFELFNMFFLHHIRTSFNLDTVQVSSIVIKLLQRTNNFIFVRDKVVFA